MSMCKCITIFKPTQKIQQQLVIFLTVICLSIGYRCDYSCDSNNRYTWLNWVALSAWVNLL
jgi:hypothetical protein